MDEEFDWNKHMKVFTHEVAVKVKKNVTKDDVLLSLLEDGDFIFKNDNGHTKMNLSHLKGKSSKEEIKLAKEVLWKQVEDYLRKVISKNNAKENGAEVHNGVCGISCEFCKEQEENNAKPKEDGNGN